MTREEAKNFLIGISYKLGNMAIEYLTEKDGEKMRNAIKALEQESCDDVISRETVKTEYKRRLEASLKDESRVMDLTYLADCTRFNEFIDSIPPVNPQPKIGHWIDDTSLGYHVSICSNCDWRGHGDTCLIYKPKYCPNCGAKMIQESEE